MHVTRVFTTVQRCSASVSSASAHTALRTVYVRELFLARSWTVPQQVTRQLMRIMRKWFCEGRKGVLVDCLFDIVRCEDECDGVAAIVQEFIWASWIAHENPVSATFLLTVNVCSCIVL
jgi:hypothetical protein